MQKNRTRYAAFLLGILVIGELILPMAQKPAYAQGPPVPTPPFVPTFDNVANQQLFVLNKQVALLNINRTKDIVQTFYEWAQSFILERLKQRLLRMIVDQVIVWIQGGGKPQFVTDFPGFIKGTADAAVGDFLQAVDFPFCEPFSFRAKFTIRTSFGFGVPPVRRFNDKVSCTLSEAVDNIENFYQDFREGGWYAFNLQIKPQNNYYGALLMGLETVSTLQGNVGGLALQEAVAGGGFLSTKKCEKDANGRDIPHTCKITTPGRVLGDTVAKAVGSDIDYIVNAEQLAEFVSAIVDAAVNRLVRVGTEGLLGLIGVNAPADGFISELDPCAGFTGRDRELCEGQQDASGSGWAGAITALDQQIDRILNIINPLVPLAQVFLTFLDAYRSDLARAQTTLDARINDPGNVNRPYCPREDDLTGPPIGSPSIYTLSEIDDLRNRITDEIGNLDLFIADFRSRAPDILRWRLELSGKATEKHNLPENDWPSLNQIADYLQNIVPNPLGFDLLDEGNAAGLEALVSSYQTAAERRRADIYDRSPNGIRPRVERCIGSF